MAEPTADAGLGDPAYGSDTKAVTYEAGGDISAGDVVAIASGVAQPAEDTTNTDDFGIAGEAGADGDNITVYTEGPVVANVAGGISAGASLTLGSTAGQLASGSGDYQALTDEGAVAGLSAGYGLPSNAAVVNF